MAIAQVQEEEVETLIASGKLSVAGNHAWKQAGEKQWFKATIHVAVDQPKPPKLRIIVSVSYANPGKFNIVLLWGVCRIRGLCFNGSHGNHHTNAEKWIQTTHKHKWTDICQCRFAYTPTDITETNVQEVFKQFCSESGITCNATLAELPTIPGVLIDDL